MVLPVVSIPSPDGGAFLLAGLLSTRICHDLASSLGAIMNSLQLARETSDTDGEAMDLASEAAIDAVRRLRLMRGAWGGDPEALDVAELRSLAAGLGRRITVGLDGIDPATRFPPDAARLVLNVMLLGAECLPRGGTIGLSGDEAELLVTIAGARAGWTQGLPACVADPRAAWAHIALEADGGTGRLQCALTALIAHESGLGISFLIAREAEAAPPLLLRLSPQFR